MTPSKPHDKTRAALLLRLDTMRMEALEQIRNATAERGQDIVDRTEQAEQQRLVDVDRGVDAIARQALSEVESACSRIEGGTYGACVSCAMPIAQERLAAHPTAIRCTSCQAAFDRAAGGAPRP